MSKKVMLGFDRGRAKMTKYLGLMVSLIFLSLTLTSCTSKVVDVLDAIEKGLGRTEEIEEEKTAIPKNYYTKDDIPNRPNTYSNLKKFLKSRVGLSGYNINKYDCSEMSAFLESRLEDAGFDACIAEGPAPWNTQVYHAWVFVRAWRDGRLDWFPIEATDPRFYNVDEGVTFRKIFSRLLKVPGIITRGNCRYYLQYFKYDNIYNSIHDIPKSKLHEYDWWNVFD